MTKIEEIMFGLLKQVQVAKTTTDVLDCQHEIITFMNSCFVPKQKFTDVFHVMKVESVVDATKAWEEFKKPLEISCMLSLSSDYVDLRDITNGDSIIKRRQDNLKKSVDEILAELDNAWYHVSMETIPRKLIDDLGIVKTLSNRKDIVGIVTIGKQVIESSIEHKEYYLSDVIIMKLNSIMFFIRLLEEKLLGYISKKES